MPFTAPVTVVSGSVITSAYGNQQIRDNIAYLKAVVDGTGADKIPNIAFTPNTISGDKIGDGTLTDAKLVNVNGSRLTDASVTGAKLAFYDSGAVNVAAGATVTLTPPFPNVLGPRLLDGVWGASLNSRMQRGPGVAGTVYFTTTTANAISVGNNTGATQSFQVWAML